MKKRVIKFFDRIIIVLLGFTGMFASCKSGAGECEPYPGWGSYPDPDSVTVVAYGIRPADFAIRGTVTNKTDGKPIPNVRVVGHQSSDFTDLKGQYVVDEYLRGSESVVYLKFEDIDGEENGGEFASKKIKVKITDADKEKIEKCKQEDGVFTKTQNIELKKK